MAKTIAPQEEEKGTPIKVISGRWKSLVAKFEGEVTQTTSDNTSDVPVSLGRKLKKGEQPPVRHLITHTEDLLQKGKGRAPFRSKLEAISGREIDLLTQRPAIGAQLKFQRVTGAPHGFSADRITSTAVGVFHSHVGQTADADTQAVISGNSLLEMKGRVTMTALNVAGRYSALMSPCPGVEMSTRVGVDPRDDEKE